MAPGSAFPFSAVVGQDEAKLALLLCAVDPAIGGVLLRGEKGSAKSTLARSLAGLLAGAGGAPFVELPLGATEDRVVGSLDIAGLLAGGAHTVRTGLLAEAHGGVLYVDEVNLLADHLVDVLLDVAASGVNRIERDGITHSHPARFVLVGSMNPEEGELRPQLLDRFGLAVTVRAPEERALRAAAVRGRLAHDLSGVDAASATADAALTSRLAAARPATIADAVVDAACALALGAGAEGLRADLILCRAAAALAGWEGRAETARRDLERVAPLVLAHRQAGRPFGAPPPGAGEIAELAAQVLADPGGPGGDPGDGRGDPGDGGGDPGDGGRRSPRTVAPGALLAAPAFGSPRHPPAGAGATPGRRSTTTGLRGRVVGATAPAGPVTDLAVTPTVLAAAARAAAAPAGTAASLEPSCAPVVRIAQEDLRQSRRVAKAGNLLVFLLDASGSMGAPARMEATKGAVLGLLADAYLRRDRIALVTMHGASAEVVLRPTASGEVARARLAELPTGGTTPLADGLHSALRLANAATGDPGRIPIIVAVTDGRATYAPRGADPLAAAYAAAADVERAGVDAIVVDAETGTARLALARELARRMGARYVHLDELTSDGIRRAVRSQLDPEQS